MIQESTERRAGRRGSDIKREMLEESMRELPKVLVTVLDDEKGLYSFYYDNQGDAKEMVEALVSEGISRKNIGIYCRL